MTSDSQPGDGEEDGMSTLEDGASTLEDGGSTVEDSVCPTEADEGVVTLEEARRVIKELRDRHRSQSHQLLAWKRRVKAQEDMLGRLARERSEQLRTLSSKLLLFEARLCRKQHDISVLLAQRDAIIIKQQRAIKQLQGRLIDTGMYTHLLPNFVECWWDFLILDVLLCNCLGIWIGLIACKVLQLQEYNWVGIRDIKTTAADPNQTVVRARWLDPSYMRIFTISSGIIFWLAAELGGFFLKHIFEVPPMHTLLLWRLLIIGVTVAPAVSQYYMYVTEPSCKRLGVHCWVFIAIVVTEYLICIKNGSEVFSQTQITNISFWLLLIFLFSYFCVYGGVLWHIFLQHCHTPEFFKYRLVLSKRKSGSETFLV